MSGSFITEFLALRASGFAGRFFALTQNDGWVCRQQAVIDNPASIDAGLLLDDCVTVWLRISMDDVAHAIADPVRREILEALRERSLTAGEIADRFTISRPAISRHLRVLRRSGLVREEIFGRHHHYTIVTEPLAPLVAWIGDLDRAAEWEHRLNALDTEVQRTRRDRRSAPMKEESA